MSEVDTSKEAVWFYCPECGCKEYVNAAYSPNFCSECGQDWWPEVDYTEAVQINLGKARALSAQNEAQAAEIERLRGVLEWYGEQARLARLIHSEGDIGRHALAADGGKRAKQALKGGSND